MAEQQVAEQQADVVDPYFTLACELVRGPSVCPECGFYVEALTEVEVNDTDPEGRATTGRCKSCQRFLEG